MEMSSKKLGGGKVSSATTTHHDVHRLNDRQKTNLQKIDSKSFIMTGISPPSQLDIITSLSGITPGTCDDLHDVSVRLYPDLPDDVHRRYLRESKLSELSYHMGGNDLVLPVNGGKALRCLVLVCPAVKKVAKTDVAGGGRRAAALTTPCLCSDHSSVLAGDLNASRVPDTAQYGRSREGPLPDKQRYTNWFSITKLLPGPALSGRHEEGVISKLDQVWKAGSQTLSTGPDRQILAWSGVDIPPVQALGFLQAPRLSKLEADIEEEGVQTINVVSVVLTTFLPLSGQQNIGG